MKKFTLLLLACFSIVNSFAQNIQVIQETDLFNRVGGHITGKPSYIVINNQPSGNAYSLNLYQLYYVQSLNHNYTWQVKIMGQEGVPESESHYYNHFDIVGNNGTVILRRYGEDDFLTTTMELSMDNKRNNYFEKIPLDTVSYALVFCGRRDYYADVPGEMIIVVVNKNEATVVYDDYATAITPTNFDSENFQMYFLKDLSGLYNPSMEKYDTSSANLGERTFYRLRKDGDMLKIAECRYVN